MSGTTPTAVSPPRPVAGYSCRWKAAACKCSTCRRTALSRPVVEFWSPAPGSWLATLPDGRYAVSPNAAPPVFFRLGGQLYPIEDLDAERNQPDAVAAALGAPDAVVRSIPRPTPAAVGEVGHSHDGGSAGPRGQRFLWSRRRRFSATSRGSLSSAG